jgi:protein CpxP
MDKRADATKIFYAALSPEQKKTFDAETARRGHRGGYGHHQR